MKLAPRAGRIREARGQSSQHRLPGPGRAEEAGGAGQVQDGGEGVAEGRKGVRFPGPSPGCLSSPDT